MHWKCVSYVSLWWVISGMKTNMRADKWMSWESQPSHWHCGCALASPTTDMALTWCLGFDFLPPLPCSVHFLPGMHFNVWPFSWNTHILSYILWKSYSKYALWFTKYFLLFSFNKEESPVKMLKLDLYTEKCEYYSLKIQLVYNFFCPKL